MAVMKNTEIVLDHRFDPKSCRHTVNGFTHVLHCHHYATLYTQLAEDVGMLDGKKLLADVAEESFNELFVDYFCKHNIEKLEDRIAIAEQYYAVTGLGKMKVLCAGMESGEVELVHSHIDEGWLKKWGKKDRPINHITAGYIAGFFSAVFNKPVKTYIVTENMSMVTGEKYSHFNVVVK